MSQITETTRPIIFQLGDQVLTFDLAQVRLVLESSPITQIGRSELTVGRQTGSACGDLPERAPMPRILAIDDSPTVPPEEGWEPRRSRPRRAIH